MGHFSPPYTSPASLDPWFLWGCAELALALPVGGLAPAVLSCFLLPLSLAAADAKITVSWDGSWADPPPPDCRGMKG